jgi:hypothetical protein
MFSVDLLALPVDLLFFTACTRAHQARRAETGGATGLSDGRPIRDTLLYSNSRFRARRIRNHLPHFFRSRLELEQLPRELSCAIIRQNSFCGFHRGWNQKAERNPCFHEICPAPHASSVRFP